MFLQNLNCKRQIPSFGIIHTHMSHQQNQVTLLLDCSEQLVEFTTVSCYTVSTGQGWKYRLTPWVLLLCSDSRDMACLVLNVLYLEETPALLSTLLMLFQWSDLSSSACSITPHFTLSFDSSVFLTGTFQFLLHSVPFQSEALLPPSTIGSPHICFSLSLSAWYFSKPISSDYSSDCVIVDWLDPTQSLAISLSGQ